MRRNSGVNTFIWCVIVAILFALALLFYVSSDISFGNYLLTAFVVGGNTLSSSTPLAANVQGAALVKCLSFAGVPLGLIGCCVGITGMATNLEDPKSVETAMSFAFTCVLYGGYFSAVGHFASKELREVRAQGHLSLGAYLLFMMVFIGTVFFAMAGAAGINEFISNEALFVFCSVFAVQISLGSKISPQKLSESVLLASILCLILTLIIWYRIGR